MQWWSCSYIKALTSFASLPSELRRGPSLQDTFFTNIILLESSSELRVSRRFDRILLLKVFALNLENNELLLSKQIWLHPGPGCCLRKYQCWYLWLLQSSILVSTPHHGRMVRRRSEQWAAGLTVLSLSPSVLPTLLSSPHHITTSRLTFGEVLIRKD